MPQQALALANGPLTRESSRLLEKPLGIGAGGKPRTEAEYVTAAFQLLLARAPRPEEMQASLAFLKETPKGASKAADSRRASLLHVLLNHHDFVTIR